MSYVRALLLMTDDSAAPVWPISGDFVNLLPNVVSTPIAKLALHSLTESSQDEEDLEFQCEAESSSSSESEADLTDDEAMQRALKRAKLSPSDSGRAETVGQSSSDSQKSPKNEHGELRRSTRWSAHGQPYADSLAFDSHQKAPVEQAKHPGESTKQRNVPCAHLTRDPMPVHCHPKFQDYELEEAYMQAAQRGETLEQVSSRYEQELMYELPDRVSDLLVGPRGYFK